MASMSAVQELDRKHVIYSWKSQGGLRPIIMDRAEGIYQWDLDGKKYIDFASGLLCVNIGHGNKHVLSAMKAQMDKLCYTGTMFGSEPKAELARQISEVTPGDLDYVFFTNSGAEAIENAIKSVRFMTGRNKIYSAWRSYHGATAGAITLTGDPRRWPAEPGIPGVVHYFGPYPYHDPFGTVDDAEECNRRSLEVLKTQIMLDGPRTIAGIFLEPIVGTNGIIIPSKTFIQGIRRICDENGILMVVDETMSGWGRSGKWFAIEHFDVIPDIITTAKGLTSAYVPLGAMVWGKKLWDFFQDRPFTGGLTYGGHALACAAGIANIEVYKRDELIENSRILGEHFARRLEEVKEKHPSVGDVRNRGLWGCIELSSNRATRAPLAGFADSTRNVSLELSRRMVEMGLTLFAKWDFIFMAPPLCISREQLDESIDIIDRALEYTDSLL